MLSSLVRDHNAKQAARKELQESRKQDALAAATQLTHTVVDQLNSRVSAAYSNQKRLDAEAKKLQANSAALAKQAQQWLQLTESFNTALKEIGDVQNWADTIEADIQTISTALENAYKDNPNVLMALFEQTGGRRVDETLPMSFAVTGYETSNGITEYTLEVHREGDPRTSTSVVKHRFSEFVALHETLVRAGVPAENLPALPPKKLIGKTEPKFLAERLAGLQSFARNLCPDLVMAAAPVKRFLDPVGFPVDLTNMLTQHAMLALRTLPGFQLGKPWTGAGWRAQRLLWSSAKGSGSPLVLAWTEFGPDWGGDVAATSHALAALATTQLPYQVSPGGGVVNEFGGLVARPRLLGSVLDFDPQSLERTSARVSSQPPRPFLRKNYELRGVKECLESEGLLVSFFANVGRHVLEALRCCHKLGILHGHVQASNVFPVPVRAGPLGSIRMSLCDLELTLFGQPSPYRTLMVMAKAVHSIEAMDVFCFAQMMFEIATGRQLNATSFESQSLEMKWIPPQLRHTLSSMLSTDVINSRLPTIDELLDDELFSQVEPEEWDELRFSAKALKALHGASEAALARLKADQAKFRRAVKTKEVHDFIHSDEQKSIRRKEQIERQSTSTTTSN